MDQVSGAIRKGDPRLLIRSLNSLQEEGNRIAERIENGEAYCETHPEWIPELESLKSHGRHILDFAEELNKDYPDEIRKLYAEGLFGLMEV
jgi:hypothetical protein